MFKLEWGEPDHPDFVEVAFNDEDHTIQLAAGQDDYEVWGMVSLNIDQAETVHNALGKAIQILKGT